MTSKTQGWATVKVRLTGDAPLLQHSARLANPMDPATKQLKAVTAKRGKVDADQEQISYLEYCYSAYVDENQRVVVPAALLSAVLTAGAKKAKKGQAFKSGVFVFENAKLLFSDQGLTINELWEKGEEYRLVSSVKVGTSRVIRTRPMFKNWSVEFTVSYDHEQVDESDILQALSDAGRRVGLGDWRPQYGRFSVEKI